MGGNMSEKRKIGRRKFLKASSMGLVGAGIMGNHPALSAPEEKKSEPLKIKEYRVLGRTGFKVSDISSGFVNNAAVLKALFDAGINYIDSAEDYKNQPVIGEVLKNINRKSVFITSKLEIKKDLTKEGFLKRARKCLEELQTDYIDCMMVHGPENVKTIKTPGFHAAMKQLKAEGRLRFVGISHHGSNWFRAPEETMEKVLMTAASDGRFDVFLLAYNFLQMDMGKRVLDMCKEKNIGTTLMKVNPVGVYLGLKEYVEKQKKQGKKIPDLYRQGLERFKEKAKKAEAFTKKYELQNPDEIRNAAIRFALSNPNVNTVCLAMRNFELLNTYIKLSGTRLSGTDNKKLSAYRIGCGELYCRHACGICEKVCPNKVPVNTIMRYNHYFEAQGKEKYALLQYARLNETKADMCINCPGFCEKACPYNVPIHGMLGMAHHRLSLT